MRRHRPRRGVRDKPGGEGRLAIRRGDGGRGKQEQATGDGDGRNGWMRARFRAAGKGAGEEETCSNFILISLCFFSLAFTKAVGSKRGTRPPRTGWGWGVERRGGWGYRITPPQF